MELIQTDISGDGQVQFKSKYFINIICQIKFTADQKSLDYFSRTCFHIYWCLKQPDLFRNPLTSQGKLFLESLYLFCYK